MFGLVFGLVLVLARQACPLAAPIASSSALVADDPRVCGRVHLGPAIGRSARHGGIGDGALFWFGPPTSTADSEDTCGQRRRAVEVISSGSRNIMARPPWQDGWQEIIGAPSAELTGGSTQGDVALRREPQLHVSAAISPAAPRGGSLGPSCMSEGTFDEHCNGDGSDE